MIQPCIIAHTDRANQAAVLQRQTGGVVFLDDGDLGAARNHIRALQWAATQPTEHTLILEDDAQPVQGWRAHAEWYAHQYPDELVSLYLGTSRPTWAQREVDAATQQADATGADRIVLPTLLHGVAYLLPTGAIPDLLTRLNEKITPIDFRIGGAWGKPVYYTWPSLVDHADGPTVGPERPDNQPRIEPRKARRLA